MQCEQERSLPAVNSMPGWVNQVQGGSVESVLKHSSPTSLASIFVSSNVKHLRLDTILVGPCTFPSPKNKFDEFLSRHETAILPRKTAYDDGRGTPHEAATATLLGGRFTESTSPLEVFGIISTLFIPCRYRMYILHLQISIIYIDIYIYTYVYYVYVQE